MGEVICIFGGTYNPVHLGHMAAVRALLEQLSPNRLLVVPTAIPPHKQMPSKSPTAGQRVDMLHLAFDGLKNVEISDLEITRGGVSYTYDTAKELRKRYPDSELWLAIGEDMFASVEHWHRHSELFNIVSIAVFTRGNGNNLDELTDHFSSSYRSNVKNIKLDPIKISSTELRELLQQRSGTEYLSDPVYGYIIRNRLYDSKPNFEWLRTKAYKMLKPSRIAHVKGCEEEAVKLAVCWGADIDSAREAAILHDITKKLDIDDQLILCSKYGIITDEMERTNSQLLHSKTGAAVAKFEFGISDEVYNAILWHTTGKAEMTTLEKIIYLADCIEGTRDYKGVEKLRALAYENLDSALKCAMESSLAYLKQKGIVPHPNTKEALDYISDCKG